MLLRGRKSLGVELLEVELGTSSLESRASGIGEMSGVDTSSVSGIADSVSLMRCQHNALVLQSTLSLASVEALTYKVTDVLSLADPVLWDTAQSSGKTINV